MADAVQTVMTQCELWADNMDTNYIYADFSKNNYEVLKVADKEFV